MKSSETFCIPTPRRIYLGEEELLLQYIERFAQKKLSELDSETILILAREALAVRATDSDEHSEEK